MLRVRRRLTPYLFICPFFIGFGAFFLAPMIYALYLSLFQVIGIGAEPKFVGLRNYLRLVQDELFLKSLGNTTYWTAGMLLIMLPVSLGLALLLNSSKLRFREMFKTLFFTPNITMGVVIALVFGLIFGEDYGVINQYVIRPLGLEDIHWLRDVKWIMPALFIMGIWRWGGVNALYFLGGIRAINPEVLEAATMDGANRLGIFRHMILPLIQPVLVFIVTLTIIGSYNTFAEPSLLLGADGGPENAGLFLTMFLYGQGFQFLRFGYASAIGYSLAIIIMVATLIQTRVMGLFSEE